MKPNQILNAYKKLISELPRIIEESKLNKTEFENYSGITRQTLNRKIKTGNWKLEEIEKLFEFIKLPGQKLNIEL